MADYNIAVTSQPHSEVAALAITVHELQKGEELKKVFGDYKLRIIPSAKGKQVEQKS
jgi:tRNA (cytidine56-2'-O)-methyltransferase